MQKVITYLLLAATVTSCVSSKSYNDLVTRESANSILISNQADEIESLKKQNNSLMSKTLSLTQDTIRLERYIRTLKADYGNAIKRSANSTISIQRKSEEYKDSYRRQTTEINELQFAITERDNKIDRLESEITLAIDNTIGGSTAILYQTKAGLSLELSDCMILNDSTATDKLDVFTEEIAKILKQDQDITLTIESYAAKNDTLTTVNEIWDMNQKKGAIYAAKFVDKGIKSDNIVLLTPSRDYPHDIPFGNGCELVTIFKFNLDATHIIDMFDKIIKGRDKNY